MSSRVQSVTPFLWFDGQAEEAARFYASLFPDGKVIDVSTLPGGEVLTVDLELGGVRFAAMNGGPQYKFTPAVSFLVACDSQSEIDRLWEAFSEGGEPMPCGWVTDRFGVTWQVVPHNLRALLQDPDGAKAKRAMDAALQMGKLDKAAIEAAHAGR